ncbi:hypothetical protein [Rhodococcus erythropolis]|uniref:hypothetical protein n=1 Tax=Rhodococcus erythropolis TaxID=1833 RepID=UPI001CD933FB|nr:hypothetical protein [Rhodococcus erythropolis]
MAHLMPPEAMGLRLVQRDESTENTDRHARRRKKPGCPALVLVDVPGLVLLPER